MPYSIPCSSKSLTLATAPFLLILNGVLCLSVNLLWCQECTFYCSLRKKCTLLPEGTDVHTQQHIYRKNLNLYLPLYYYGKVIVELKKKQQGNGTCDMTKQLFRIPISFRFQLMSLSNLFLKFGKFLVLYLDYGCFTFDFITEMTLRRLLTHPKEYKKLEFKDHQIYSEMLRKICKNEV